MPLERLEHDLQKFIETFWGRAWCHDSAAGLACGDAVLTCADAESLLFERALAFPQIRVVRDGSVQARSRFVQRAAISGESISGLSDPRALAEAFAEGATLVLQGLHRFHKPARLAAAALERALGLPCQANAYVTPASSQGFALHSDPHHVFVAQTHGSKRWLLRDSDGEEHEVDLQSGMGLYIPLGMRHAARATDDISVHVTFGVKTPSAREVVAHMAHSNNPVLDTPLPPRPGGAGDWSAPLAHALAAAAKELAGCAADGLATAEWERFATSRLRRAATGLHPEQGRDLDARSQVARQAGSWCEELASPDPARCRYALGDRVISLPAPARPAMAWIAQRQTPFTPAALEPFLDPSSALVLVRRLIREGLLQWQM